MEKKRSTATINTVDRFGHDLTITYTGVDQQELAHFGGLDLHISATKTMISDINGLYFPEKDRDYFIRLKVAALYLNEIGSFLRNSSLDPELLEGYSNMDLVKNFIEDLRHHPDVVEVVKRDDELIQREIEETRKEEDEIWANIMKNIKKD